MDFTRLRRLAVRGAASVSLLSAALGVAVSQAPPAAASVPATAVTLTASTLQATTGDTVTFTATVNGDIQPGQYIDIVNLTDSWFAGSCEYPVPSWQCPGDDTFYEPHTARYKAYIDNDSNPDNVPPTGVTAQSAEITVTWSDPPPPPDPGKPSVSMCGSTQPIDYADNFPQRRLTVVTGPPTIVCVSALNIGGALVINAPIPGAPDTDNNVSACTLNFDDHPLGHTIIVGFGLSSTEASVCLTVDSSATRVKIPIGGAPSVDWYGDDGSHYGTSGGGGGGGVIGSGSCSASASAVVGVPRMCIMTGGI